MTTNAIGVNNQNPYTKETQYNQKTNTSSTQANKASQNAPSPQNDYAQISDESRMANFAPIDMPEDAPTIRAAGQLFRAMREVTTVIQVGLDGQTTALMSAFKSVRESITDLDTGAMQSAFLSISLGMFAQDAEMQFRSTTSLSMFIETSEGRILNEEYLQFVEQARSEGMQRARQFVNEFLAGLGL